VVRLRRLTAPLTLALAVAALAPPVAAQSLQRLTVQSFGLGTDTNAPAAGVPFHLIVTLRVRERVMRIDNLELPLLAELELLGDERHLQSGPGGTEYRETIAVVARQAGTISIAPALLQAVDARDGRAKQYATNGLVLRVAGPAPSLQGAASAAESLAASTLRVALLVLGVCSAVALVVLLARRRSVPPPAPPRLQPVVPPAAPARTRTARDEFADALAVLSADPSRATAVRIRTVVWSLLGAEEGATLADVLARPTARSAAMSELLRALERAAFTYDEDLPAAIARARRALEHVLEVMT